MPILAGASFVFVLLLAYVASRPAYFRIARKRAMKASPDAVFALIQDLRAWGQWSPWDKLDPNMTRTFEGAESGVGAKYHWVGNKQVGEGRMAVLEVAKDEKVVVDLQFIKPFPAHNKTTFTIAREGDGVVVTWLMEGNNNFMAKAFNVFVNMDKLVGADFERGLESLEGAARARSADQRAAA